MIRTVLGSLFILIGIIGFIVEVAGNLKFNHILKRMQAAGIGDSFALGSYLIGCIIFNGLNLTSLKLIAAGVILFFTSPVCSHMLAKLAADTDEELNKYCEVEK